MSGIPIRRQKICSSSRKAGKFHLFCGLLSLLLVTAFSSTALAQAAPVRNIQNLGKGAVALSGPWQFHLGDNPDYASPALDDATGHDGWAQISGSKPWGEQGYRSYTGYAWYRKHLHVSAARGVKPDFALYIGRISNVYAIYLNGRKVAQYGKFPPHAVYYNSFESPTSAQIWPIGSMGDGVLAIRVWKAPYLSIDTGLLGGFDSAPYLGSPAALANMKGQREYLWLRVNQYRFAMFALYLLVTVLGLLFWLRDRSQRILFWLAVYCGTFPLSLALRSLHLPLSFGVAMGLDMPVLAMMDVGLWFLLLYLLRLDENTKLVRLTRYLAWCSLVATTLDGVLLWKWGSITHVREAQIADAVFTVVFTVVEAYPLFLIAMGLRKRLDAARWSVAFFAFTVHMINVIASLLSQGRRFTHWTFASMLYKPLFTINGNPFPLIALGVTGLLVSILYAVYRYSRETIERKRVLDRELQSAQELQKVLIPESLPALPGYSVTSSYRPAAEVGGDFFQIFPLPDGSSVVVLGDVSGHGLRAAMAVSMIVGALHTLVERSSDPAEILAGLNRRLYNRLPNGFATCLVLHLDKEGNGVIASAGHPAPFLNNRELRLLGALPLGLIPDAECETSRVRVAEGDTLTLFTDGLIEARSATGELFSFDRLKDLMAEKPDAEHAAQMAQNFGQEDDITVLTIIRLGQGEESTTVLAAPVFAQA